GGDFFVIGDADTARRSPSTGAAYFESYASIFIVSARTGRLVSWERPLERRDTAEEAEKALLKAIDNADRYRVTILRALEDESAERASAVEATPTAIEVMSDERDSSDARAPRPYR